MPNIENSKGIKIGDIIKYSEIVDAGDAIAQYKVLDMYYNHRNDLIFNAQFICDMYLKPTDLINIKDCKKVN